MSGAPGDLHAVLLSACGEDARYRGGRGRDGERLGDLETTRRKCSTCDPFFHVSLMLHLLLSLSGKTPCGGSVRKGATHRHFELRPEDEVGKAYF